MSAAVQAGAAEIPANEVPVVGSASFRSPGVYASAANYATKFAREEADRRVSAVLLQKRAIAVVPMARR